MQSETPAKSGCLLKSVYLAFGPLLCPEVADLMALRGHSAPLPSDKHYCPKSSAAENSGAQEQESNTRLQRVERLENFQDLEVHFGKQLVASL